MRSRCILGRLSGGGRRMELEMRARPSANGRVVGGAEGDWH